MGVFGVATVHEDDALRAVRASLEAREALTAEAGVLPRHYGASLVYRFGLATGEALVGGPGPARVRGGCGSPGGDARGGRRAGPDPHQPARPSSSPPGPSRPTDAGPDRFLLRSAHAGLRPLAVRLDAPLVGRGEEMRRLEAAYARATRERVTMTVTVIGEAGLGKTRLVQEFARRLGREAHVLTGRCLSYGEGITFWPLREVVRQAGGGDDSPERIKELLAGEDGRGGRRRAASPRSRPRQPGQDGRRGDLLGRPALSGSPRAAPAGAGRLRGPALGRTDLPRPGGVACPPAGAIADRHGLHRPPGTARPASGLGGRGRQVGLHPARAARRRPGRGAARLAVSGSAHRHRPPGHGSSTPLAAIPSTWSNWPSPSASRAEAISGRRCRPRLRPCWRRGSSASGRAPAASSSGPPSSARTSASGKSGNCSRPRRARRSAATSRPSSPRAWCNAGRPAEVLDEEYSFRHILIQEAAYRSIPKSLRAELHHRYADWLEAVVANPSPGARRSSAITSNSRSATAPSCGPPIPSPPRCRSGRPHTSRRPGTPRMTAATTSRR